MSIKFESNKKKLSLMKTSGKGKQETRKKKKIRRGGGQSNYTVPNSFMVSNGNIGGLLMAWADPKKKKKNKKIVVDKPLREQRGGGKGVK